MPEISVPVMVALAEPRPLDPAERALLDALVDGTGSTDLRAQARSATVVSICSCGCPSVGLTCTGPQLSTVDMIRFSAHDRDDVFGIHAYCGNTEVVVHVLEGRLAELEIYAGEGVAPPLPSPETLTNLEIY